MDSTKNAYNQYLRTAVFTATKEKLLLMLYDGLVNALKQAIQAIEGKNIPKAHVNLMKSQEIITELMGTLNMEYEISDNLYQLYDYYKRRLIAANFRKDPAIIEEVLGMVVKLRSAWAAAEKQLRTGGDHAYEA